MENIKRKIVAIVGPTASGKTSVGVKLAKELNGEIVSADSRQVYKGLDIGTGKDLAEYDGVKYHMIDICNPGERFTLFDYLPLTRATIEDIFKRGKVPIIVGGTGLYVQGLVEGFEFKKSEIRSSTSSDRPECQSNGRNPKSETNSKYQILNREQLNNLTIQQLNNLLKKLDPKSFEIIDTQNPHRLIRAIEKAQEGNVSTKSKPDFEVLQIGVTWSRETLYSRIDKRVDERFKEEMLEEIIELLNAGVDSEWLVGLGLEYREITNYIIQKSKFNLRQAQIALSASRMGKSQNYNSKFKSIEEPVSFEQMQQVFKYKIHHFARRQLTWFRRFPEIVWESDYKKIKKMAKNFIIN